jgi:hypothetical protein
MALGYNHGSKLGASLTPSSHAPSSDGKIDSGVGSTVNNGRAGKPILETLNDHQHECFSSFVLLIHEFGLLMEVIPI